MEENFDIDKHIDKIKNQMGQDFQASNITDAPDDILENVPNNEPLLDAYGEDLNAQSDETSESEKDIQEHKDNQDATQENLDEINQDYEYENEWQDPFGTNENDAVKKYVIYIAKDFVPLVDHMDKDARSAFVNESIQLKLQMEGKERKWHVFTRVLRHIIVSVFTLLIIVPALFWLADKSINATVQNYEYVQKSFEKLYKDKAERDKAAREIQQMRLGL